ncbi:hypothetical protein CK203_038962 [Vitis vinifera]|uniref:Uncharacterized protein n=1 Tax=Vitis vinifera TaxID=29760 RepID=A0A438HLX5_VITVI|nr:hypothetical protein CK203_038962 [Vitis vinifera]
METESYCKFIRNYISCRHLIYFEACAIVLIYAVGSSSDNGIHLLDFYPDSSSPCHVEYSEDMQSLSGVKNQSKQNMFVPLSEGVTACATHPLNGTIIAGTKQSSLLVISQRHKSCQGDHCQSKEEGPL